MRHNDALCHITAYLLQLIDTINNITDIIF